MSKSLSGLIFCVFSQLIILNFVRNKIGKSFLIVVLFEVSVTFTYHTILIEAKEEVSDEKLRQSTLIITSIEDCIKPLEEYFNAGYTRLYPHSTSPDEIKFIQDFSKKVLPYFSDKNPS